MLRDLGRPLISIVIPLAREEREWVGLCSDLSLLKDNVEIIFIIPNDVDPILLGELISENLEKPFLIIKSLEGRANQLNAGAARAKGEWIWFLHADTRFDIELFDKLVNNLNQSTKLFFYFDLKFLTDGFSLMYINSIGVWLRSHLFKLPFGDQGFCVRRKEFDQLGGFDTHVPFGEDLVFVKNAKRKNIKPFPVGGYIKTSARKYEQYGWAKTTIKHLFFTIKQSLLY